MMVLPRCVRSHPNTSFALWIYDFRFTIYDSSRVLNLEQLSELFGKNRAAASARVREFSIGGKHFAFNSRPVIMGVINLSPDSWYRESVCLTTEAAVQRGKVLRAQGADIVDVGAESTLAQAARDSAADAETPWDFIGEASVPLPRRDLA